jgi:hypothetical protein
MPIPDLNPRPVPYNKATKSNMSIPISINISLGNSPKKGRDIGTIFEARSSTNFIKTQSTKTFLQ